MAQPRATRKPRLKPRKETRDKSISEEELVNLGVKVPLSWRRHWAAESKREGVSMTEIIIQALTSRFGRPE
jgi:hypothetical protein